MTGRIVLGGIVGGIVLFMWGVVWHTVLEFGDTGIHGFPDEEAVMSVLEEGIPEPGMYFFPYWDHSIEMDTEEAKAAMNAWEEAYEAGPIGLLLYRPTGVAPMFLRIFLMGRKSLQKFLISRLSLAFIVARLTLSPGAGPARAPSRCSPPPRGQAAP